MKNLTATQSEIIKNIEAEFLKINEVDNTTDILEIIDNAINEKHILRKELEIIDRQNRKSIEAIKSEILETLQSICNKYGFYLECGKYINDNEYMITIKFNNYFKDNYPTLLKEARAILILPKGYKDNIKYIKSPVPTYTGYCYKGKFESKEEFIKYFVDETINVLKSKI
jgi:hypothetical protein